MAYLQFVPPVECHLAAQVLCKNSLTLPPSSGQRPSDPQTSPPFPGLGCYTAAVDQWRVRGAMFDATPTGARGRPPQDALTISRRREWRVYQNVCCCMAASACSGLTPRKDKSAGLLCAMM